MTKAATITVTLVGIGLVAALVVVRTRLSVNPHYTLGKQDLQAGNYGDAVSQFRLCLSDDPNDQKAKGLLAYSVIRTELEDRADSSSAEDVKPEDELLTGFMHGYEVNELDENLDLFRGDAKKQIDEAVKSYRKSLRDDLTKYRVSFNDWTDLTASTVAAAQELYPLKPGIDNAADERAKDIAAAIVAAGGDSDARDYLVKRTATNPDLLPLTLVVGDSITASLRQESSNKESFIQEESGNSLRLLALKPGIASFASTDPSFRQTRKADMPKDQRNLLDEKPVPFLGDDEATVVVTIESLKSVKADPAAIHVRFIDDDASHLVLLSGYSGSDSRFRCRLLMWDGQSYQQVSLGSGTDMYSSLPIGSKAEYDSKKNRLLIGVDKIQLVTRTRTEKQSHPVTRYRVESRYDPSSNTGYGGYVNVTVPYTDYEMSPVDVDYKEPAIGEVWHEFSLQPEAAVATETRRLWVENSESYDTALEKAKRESAEESPKAPQSNGVRSQGGVDIDTMIALCLQAPVAPSDFTRLSKSELRLVRNGIFAMKGYIFRSPDLRRYFAGKSWYTPLTSSMDSVMGTMNPTQKANIDLIKSLETK